MSTTKGRRGCAASGLAAVVGANIRSAREEAHMRQHDLAVAVGRVDAMAISRWERGVNRPNDRNLVRLSQVLDHPVAWFYGDHSLDVDRDAA